MKEQLAAFGIMALQTIILPLLGLVLALAGVRLQAWIQAKVKTEQLAHVLARLERTIEIAVKEVEQTFISTLTAPTQELYAEAKRQALDSVRSHLGVHGLSELKAVLDLENTEAVEKFMTTVLEAKVHDLKMSGGLS